MRTALLQANAFTFLTPWVITWFWGLVVFGQHELLDKFRLLFLFVSFSGIVLDWLYGEVWERKFGIPHELRLFGNIAYHVLPFVYLVCVQARTCCLVSRDQILRLFLVLACYRLLVDPNEQYR